MARRRFIWNPHLKQLVEVFSVDTVPDRHGPDVMGDLPGYESPVDGAWVEGRAARRADLAKHNCRPYEEGEKQDTQRRIAAEERALESKIERTVEAQFYGMSARQKERLISELRAGATTEYVRK
jgi:hypothetical protein